MKKTFLLFAVLFVVAGLRAQTMDLSGLWRFQFDPMGFGMRSDFQKEPGSHSSEPQD